MRRSFLVRAAEADDAVIKLKETDPEWKTLIQHTAGALRKYMLTAEPEFAGDTDFEQALCAAFLDDVLEELFPGYKGGAA